MAAKYFTTTHERLAATPLLQSFLVTNGTKAVSVAITVSEEDGSNSRGVGLTFTAEEAEVLAAALIAKASNLRNETHDNSEEAI